MRKTMIRLNQRLALCRAVGAPKEKNQDPMKFSKSVSDRRTDKVSYRGASLLKREKTSRRKKNILSPSFRSYKRIIFVSVVPYVYVKLHTSFNPTICVGIYLIYIHSFGENSFYLF